MSPPVADPEAVAMPRRILPVLVLIVAAGCGSDPADSPLKPGQMVVVAENNWLDPTDPGALPLKLDPGVKLTVGRDPGEYVEDPRDVESRAANEAPAEAERIRKAGPAHSKPGDALSGLRKIAVVVETGALAGQSGTVRRNCIRPLP